ncbi:MAG: glutamine--fructose-6-phosphate transaminase (isomerizing) [Dehalococcoidales bacterium]|nr:glutamine--fructose-6-phosphate transaminase (isomerizing) [Dehalococcoidales bacterium]
MCGIVGYIGEKPAASVLLDTLSRLEYRGYDSAGIATLYQGQIHAGKDAGSLMEVVAKQHLDMLPGNIGIGHTRWATHGGISAANAHPHMDCDNEIAVVHNGIIENYEILRQRLKGTHRFLSQTDSEVIPHLLDEYVHTGLSLEQALQKVVKELEGSYAILAISSREPDKIVGARRESPLIIGISPEGNYLASDALAFHGITDRVILIEEGECVVVTRVGVSIYNESGEKVKRAPIKTDWYHGELSKGLYDYFMLKEIHEQPAAIRRAVCQETAEVMAIAAEIRRVKHVVFTACGTSRHAALIGRYVFSKVAGIFGEVVMASEFEYFIESVDSQTLVLAISQSGETADVLDGVRRAKVKGAKIISLVNTVDSSLARLSDRVLYMKSGPEVGVAATKTFTAQLTLLYLLAFALADKYEEGKNQLTSVTAKIEESLVADADETNDLALKLKNQHDFYFIARGINFAVAAEGALKLKEVAYVHAEGMPAGELKHGTLALIDRGTPVVAICPHDYTFDEILPNIAETAARGAYVIGVSDKFESLFNEWIRIPPVPELFYPLVTIIPLQLFAYHSAVFRALDPDKPRNLAKSVTVK